MALKPARGRVSPPSHPPRSLFARSVSPSSSSIWSHCISCHDRARVHVTAPPSRFVLSLPSSLPLSLPPPPTPLAGFFASPHRIRCPFFPAVFLGGDIEDAADFRRSRSGGGKKKTQKIKSSWRAPRTNPPTRRTRPVGRIPSTTRGPGRYWVARPAAGVRIPPPPPIIQQCLRRCFDIHGSST